MMSSLTKEVGGVPEGAPIVGASPAFAVTDGMPGVVTVDSSAFLSPPLQAVNEDSERAAIATRAALRSFIWMAFQVE